MNNEPTAASRQPITLDTLNACAAADEREHAKAAFDAYWAGVMKRQKHLSAYGPREQIRGINLAILRAAQAEAFKAGRESK